MALRDAYADPYRIVGELVSSPTEKARQRKAHRRVQLYHDRVVSVVTDDAERVYTPEVFSRVLPWISFSGSNSLLKRIADEIARPVYATVPVRTIKPKSDQANYSALAKEIGLQRRMRHASRMSVAVNDVHLFARVSKSGEAIVDVITPDMMTIVPSLDNPAKPLAYSYSKQSTVMGRVQTVHVVWDEEEFFSVTPGGVLVEGPVKHGLGRAPWVEIHRTYRCGNYWDEDTGEDLVAGTRATCLLNTMLLRLQKNQGHQQLVHIGESSAAPHNTIIDQLSLMQIEGVDSTVQSLDLQASPENYIKTIDKTETSLAANYGISRERLNQQTKEPDDNAVLYERTSEVTDVMREAEVDLFDVIKRLSSKQHPVYEISDEARVSVDFGAFSARGDREKQLKIRKEERSQGVRTVIDDIMEDNPEIRTVKEAWRKLDENMAIEADFIERRRALNISEKANIEEPGQDPEDNGRMGPQVRDGLMTKDNAALLAKTGANGVAKQERESNG